ncbi:unnamed protein product, partial [Phaeothamnion confervicola]
DSGGWAATLPPLPAPFSVEHYLAARGGMRGTAVTHVSNRHSSTAIVTLLHPFSWCVAPRFGSLRAVVLGPGPDDVRDVKAELLAAARRRTGDAAASVAGAAAVDYAVEDWYRSDGSSVSGSSGGSSRSRGGAVTGGSCDGTTCFALTPASGKAPALLELRLALPAGSTLVVGVGFWKRFLAIDDFPPDPARGLDVLPPLAAFCIDAPPPLEAGCQGLSSGLLGAAVLLSGDDSGGGDTSDLGGGSADGTGRCTGCQWFFAYAEAPVLDVPQPDFSMPFNVITLTSTAAAF